MRIADALDRYLVQLEADGRSPHTIAQARRHVRLIASWFNDAGHTGQVGEIDHEDIARFLASPAARCRPDGQPKKPSSTNALRSSVRAFFAYAHAAG
jgi:site-specific recombinase XerD